MFPAVIALLDLIKGGGPHGEKRKKKKGGGGAERGGVDLDLCVQTKNANGQGCMGKVVTS